MSTVNYTTLIKQALALMEPKADLTANLANLSALLAMELEQINWVGFYLCKGEELLLGPFQGKPACVRIPFGRGVCGTAVSTGKVQRVYDVHQFEGHIACDNASNSEIVIPFYLNGQIAGVLDVDSPIVGRFTESDEMGLTKLMFEIERLLNYHTNEA